MKILITCIACMFIVGTRGSSRNNINVCHKKKLTLLGKYVLGNRSFSLTIEKQTKNLIHI